MLGAIFFLSPLPSCYPANFHNEEATAFLRPSLHAAQHRGALICGRSDLPEPELHRATEVWHTTHCNHTAELLACAAVHGSRLILNF